MSIKSKIDCPECGVPIHFESSLLLAGQAFSCSNPSCGVTISLTATDKEVVSDAFDKFEQMRNEATHQAGRYDA
ncbi:MULTISPECIES: hypothetical protein [Pseudoalteromonas]|uniref:Uncharacterized protein n=1 Tax=Pseudoalteromonas rubra TaxID=43658 RepID=A0A0U2XD20_9GAMM|nr:MULTISPECIES: hypothetical protein [Pseudoalteromonas]ALU45748.1 hypothetical protein AT705_22720 [Pseudoalteromonas rubra]MDK1310148.1 hypothetical protein [Pseudoalteromonas sp. R96]